MTTLSDTDQAPPRNDGYIALKRKGLGDIITPQINNNQYVFTTRANISMAWVRPEDVEGVLQVRCGCCGNRSTCFLRANVSDVRRYENGGGF